MVTLAPVLNWPFPSPSDQTRTTHPGTGKEGKSRCSMTNAHTGLCTSILVQSPFYHSSFTPPLRALFFCDSEKYFQTLGANIVELCDELKSSPLLHPPTHTHTSIPMKPPPPFCPFLEPGRLARAPLWGSRYVSMSAMIETFFQQQLLRKKWRSMHGNY